MKDALDTTHEIVQNSSKNLHTEMHVLSICKAEMAPDKPGIRVLCPTQWTIRAEALQSILENYQVLLELRTQSVDTVQE